MKSPNGDVYRNLRNTYGHLCSWIENKADEIERQAIEAQDATDQGHSPTGEGMAQALEGAAEQEMK